VKTFEDGNCGSWIVDRGSLIGGLSIRRLSDRQRLNIDFDHICWQILAMSVRRSNLPQFKWVWLCYLYLGLYIY